MTARNVALIACLPIVALHIPVLAQPPSSQAAPDGRGFVPPPVDPRVQIRTYRFEEANEEIPYAVYVSSKVQPDRQNPLVVALHGLCGSHTSLLRGNALDLAEEGGYILVGPMGYNPRGWYGVPAGTGPGARGRGPVPQNPAAQPGQTSAAPPSAQAAPAAAPRPRPAPCGQAEDPPNLRELSEKDILNVLDLMRKEFNVDERRTYLMGHSMGGAGTFHLAVKYPANWAAIAAIAPAAFSLEAASIATIPDMPVIVVHGDMDTAVPVSVSRAWVDVMKEHEMTHEYLEIAGGDHGNVIATGMPDIIAFFDAHLKPTPRGDAERGRRNDN
jgi:poly(3-hydroxybutyrate) depolymerase